MNGRLLILVCSLSFFLAYFSRLAWSILGPLSTLHPSVEEDSYIFSLFFAGYVVVQIPAGVLVDRMSFKIVLLLSLVGIAITSLGSGLADSIRTEYLLSIFMGLSAGWIYPSTVKAISGSFSGKELAQAMGVYSLAWPLSIIAAGYLLPPIATELSWRWGYFFVTALSVMTVSLLPTVKPTPNFNSPGRLEDIRDVVLISGGGFLFFTAYWAVALYFYDYALRLTDDPIVSGLIYSLTALPGIVSTVLSSRLINRLGHVKSLVVTVSSYGLLLMLIPLARGPLSLAILATLMGGVRFLITPAHSTAIARIGREGAGKATGIANTFWQFSGVTSSVMAGWIVTSLGYQWLWIMMGFISIISTLLYSRIGITGK